MNIIENKYYEGFVYEGVQKMISIEGWQNNNSSTYMKIIILCTV